MQKWTLLGSSCCSKCILYIHTSTLYHSITLPYFFRIVYKRNGWKIKNRSDEIFASLTLVASWTQIRTMTLTEEGRPEIATLTSTSTRVRLTLLVAQTSDGRIGRVWRKFRNEPIRVEANVPHAANERARWQRVSAPQRWRHTSNVGRSKQRTSRRRNVQVTNT